MSIPKILGRQLRRDVASKCFAPAALAAAFVLFVPGPSHAQWQGSGSPVCVTTGHQQVPKAVPDGAGGVILVWTDTRSGVADLYAQRLDADGVAMWGPTGTPVCTQTFDQVNPEIAADGAGGVVVAWQDSRSGLSTDIYAQRLGPDGAPVWTVNGVAVCTALNDQLYPAVASDGKGGAVMAWEDLRNGLSTHMPYAQRIDAQGVARWTPDGISIGLSSTLGQIAMVSDWTGGAIAVWRAGSSLVGQDLDSAGVAKWGIYPILISTRPTSTGRPALSRSSPGNLHVAWGTVDLYAQRMFGANRMWTDAGDTLTVAHTAQGVPAVVSNGDDGLIAAWQDNRSDFSGDIYAQRLLPTGKPRWTANGVPVCTRAGAQVAPVLVSDGAAGAILVWNDLRDSPTGQIYAQRVDSAGTPRWEADGVRASSSEGDKAMPVAIADGQSGAIVAWQEWQAATYLDIFAGRIGADGIVPALAALVRGTAFEDRVELEWYSATLAGSVARVLRRDATTAWVEAGSLEFDGMGHGRLVDRFTIEPGRHHWVLTSFDGRDTLSLVATLDIDSHNQDLAIDVQNPVRANSLVARLQLPHSTPACLELIDLAGRIIQIEALPASRGAALLTFRVAPTGLYWLRLSQGPRAVTKKVVLLR